MLSAKCIATLTNDPSSVPYATPIAPMCRTRYTLLVRFTSASADAPTIATFWRSVATSMLDSASGRDGQFHSARSTFW